jgi:hypothetical protein
VLLQVMDDAALACIVRYMMQHLLTLSQDSTGKRWFEEVKVAALDSMSRCLCCTYTSSTTLCDTLDLLQKCRIQFHAQSCLLTCCDAPHHFATQGLSLDQQQQMQLDAEAALFVQQQLGSGADAHADDGLQAARGGGEAVGVGVDEDTLAGDGLGQAGFNAGNALVGAAADGGQEGAAVVCEGSVGEGGLREPSAAGEGVAAATAAEGQHEDMVPGGEGTAGGKESQAGPAGGPTNTADAAATAPAAEGDGADAGAVGGADACAPPLDAVIKLEGNTEARSELTGVAAAAADAAAGAGDGVAPAASAAGDGVGDVEAAVLGGRQRTAPSMLETLLSSN